MFDRPHRARRSAGILLLGLAGSLGGAGCTPPAYDIEFTVYPPSSADSPVELPAISWEENVFEWQTFALLNETWFPLVIKNVELTGGFTETAPTPDDGVLGWEDMVPGNTWLEVGDLDQPVAEVPIREREILQLRFEPPKAGERTLWTTNTYKAQLNFQVHPGSITDPLTTELITDPERLPQPVNTSIFVTFDINCDIDGDGFDAFACAGTDCNDSYANISPLAEEVCDGVDNNCRDSIDEGCQDP